MLIFKERGNPEYPEKSISEQRREPTTNSTHIWCRRRDLNPGHTGGRRWYKYLGVGEGDGIQHCQMKEKVRKQHYHRIWMVLKSELNSANKQEAINTLVVPVVTYSFNIIN